MKKFIFLISLLSLLAIFSIAKELFYLQLACIIIGFISFFFLSKFKTHNLQPFWPFIYLLTIILLSAVFFEPETRGSHRWLTLFFIRFQPSEFAKPLIIFSLAGLFSSFANIRFKNIFLFLAFFLIPFFLILKQPDLGNALVYLFIFAVLILALNFKPHFFILVAVIILLTSPILWNNLAPYQKARLTSFFTPQYDISGEGYNALQALIAVGSGETFGRGFGQGTQSRLRFLPERHTDFIFSSFVEETGFIGGFMLLVLYLFLFLKIVSYLRDVHDSFSRFFIIGIFSQIFIQVFINCGMNLGILPITGITLPLFSYGGSSIVSTFVSLGIVNGMRETDQQTIAIN